ncbi:MAG TPA: hypothetical protein DCX07_15250 [Phycisphaerales bacterium]|nr:hypothetical protein [Phycisphaerales bacterium]
MGKCAACILVAAMLLAGGCAQDGNGDGPAVTYFDSGMPSRTGTADSAWFGKQTNLEKESSFWDDLREVFGFEPKTKKKTEKLEIQRMTDDVWSPIVP